MKKIAGIALSIACASALAIPVAAFAAPHFAGADRVTGACVGYERVCDGEGFGSSRQGADAPRPNWVDEDADGICDNRGSHAGARAGWVDEDADGVCDNRGSASGCRGKGAACGAGANA